MGILTVSFENKIDATKAEFQLKGAFKDFTIRSEEASSTGLKPSRTADGGVVLLPKVGFEICVIGPKEVDDVEKFCKAKGWVCERT